MTIRARLLAIEETAGRTVPRDSEAIALTEAAAGAAAVACIEQNLTDKQEAAIAALLTEPTYARAAAVAGISEGTLYRWLHLPAFRAAFRQARRGLCTLNPRKAD
jgi:DNA-directed RNA polymerase specialized sigma24 family protein